MQYHQVGPGQIFQEMNVPNTTVGLIIGKAGAVRKSLSINY